MVVPLQRLVNQDDVQLPTMGFNELGPLQPLVVPAEVTVVVRYCSAGRRETCHGGALREEQMNKGSHAHVRTPFSSVAM